MAFWVILVILLLGLLLIFLEIFFIPGTTLFGVAGGIAVFIGIILMYSYYGKTYGNITLGVSFVAIIICLVLGFRVIETNKLAMKAEITGKVNEPENYSFVIGEKGIAATELRPNGKGIFGENKVEVFSSGDYIQRDSAIEIIKISDNKIFVKPIKS